MFRPLCTQYAKEGDRDNSTIAGVRYILCIQCAFACGFSDSNITKRIHTKKKTNIYIHTIPVHRLKFEMLQISAKPSNAHSRHEEKNKKKERSKTKIWREFCSRKFVDEQYHTEPK